MSANLTEKFICEQCGNCCRHAYKIRELKDFLLPSGVCKYLNEETNRCIIYQNRPLICRVDEFYNIYLKERMSRKEFHLINKKCCEELKKL